MEPTFEPTNPSQNPGTEGTIPTVTPDQGSQTVEVTPPTEPAVEQPQVKVPEATPENLSMLERLKEN